ncbi:hypothetical protein ACFORH_43085 [Amycolatopsis roodepoortensis]|uniref:Uncharacterized protein n=1 Tax=Amycolatopsis roodepoortensis TaxID=700274 RepID=A0ABR9LIE9_9PSEU|nr:hypothetical protein [Amycolatopsis roodepoortensis]MBE1580474.1 hypothetical protein [Amycolatopsis roodepoortensis]
MSAVHELPQPTPASTTDQARPPVPPETDMEKTIPNIPAIRPDTHLSVVPPPGTSGPAGDNWIGTGEPVGDSGGSPVDRAKAWTEDVAKPWAKDLFGPPDIATKDRPSLQKLRRYGKENTQTPNVPVLRAASQAWSWIAMYHAARGYTRAWLMERPVRAVVFLALLITASLLPGTRTVLTVLLWPAHTVIELLTNY